MGTMPVPEMVCEWLPVDTLAKNILDLAGIFLHKPDQEMYDQGPLEGSPQSTDMVYNIRSPHTLSWTNHLPPALIAAGLDFSPVSFSDWYN